MNTNTRPLQQPLLPGAVFEEAPNHRWLLLAATVLAVFAACFGIGRVTSRGVTHSEASTGQSSAPAAAVVPLQLAGAPAIDVADVPPPPPPAPPPRRTRATPRVTLATSIPTATPSPATTTPVERSVPAPAPEPTHVQAAPSPAPTPSSGGGHSGSSGSGGGTFDSSG